MSTTTTTAEKTTTTTTTTTTACLSNLLLDEGSISLNCYLTTANLPVLAASPTGGGGVVVGREDAMTKKKIQNEKEKKDNVVYMVKDLMERINKLESKLYGIKEVDDNMRRARLDVLSKKCYSAVWKWVPNNYYDMSLSDRAKTLGGAGGGGGGGGGVSSISISTKQLCKAMLMENRAFDKKKKASSSSSSSSKVVSTTTTTDRTFARYYLVIVQYTATINTRKLELAIRSLRPMDKGRLDPSMFEFRVAKEEDNLLLTGYAHNSVTPFGLIDETNIIPIVLPLALVDELKLTSTSTTTQPFFFMGGGHVNLKLGMAIEEFINVTNAIVADVTDPRF